jgi:integrase/recombinase XerD
MKLTSARVGKLWDEYLSQKGLAVRTVKSYQKLYRDLSRFLYETRGPGWDWREITRRDGVEYLAWMEAKGWAFGTRRLNFKAGLWVVRLLWKRKLILSDPWQTIELKYRKNLVRAALSEPEMASFLEGIETQSFRGLRDRGLFELMYSSGLRPGEASRVKAQDFDAEARMLMIRQSKFGKDRIVPVTETAMRWIAQLMAARKADYLFGSTGKKPLSSSALAQRFLNHTQSAGVWREGLSPHSLRHSCARHLLAHGADIRYVQKLLGHESIETTVVYTYEQNDQLKKVYRRYHPREGILYREVDAAYRSRVNALKARLEPLMERRLTRRSKTSLEEAPGTG